MKRAGLVFVFLWFTIGGVAHFAVTRAEMRIVPPWIPCPLAAVWIDPESKLWLDSPMTHHYRIEGEGAAALRGAAWFSATAQTLMQVIGP